MHFSIGFYHCPKVSFQLTGGPGCTFYCFKVIIQRTGGPGCTFYCLSLFQGNNPADPYLLLTINLTLKFCVILLGSSHPPLLPLPVDPLLTSSLPSLPSLVSPSQSVVPSVPTSLLKNPASVVAEGIPPIPTKLLEKIRCWEFIDLSMLSGEQIQCSDDPPSYYFNNNQ